MKTVMRSLLALFVASATAGAATVTLTLTPVADSTVQSAYSGNNFGADSSFQAGGRRYVGVARGLLRFDIANSLPAGATINSVSLTLTVTRTPQNGINSIFDLHPLLESWGEGDNTGMGGAPADANESSWNNRFAPGTPWRSPGGTFSSAVSASQFISGNGSYMFASTPRLVSDVQSWLNNPGNNFGWELVSTSETVPTTIRRFGSRTAGPAAPALTINYTPVPEPGVLPLVALGGLGLLLAPRWRARRLNHRSSPR